MRTVARHGTPSGWAKHQREGERPCDPCYQAKAEYDRRRLTAPEKSRRNRLHARAQARARMALVHRYPDEYRGLYAAAKAELFDTQTEDTTP